MAKLVSQRSLSGCGERVVLDTEVAFAYNCALPLVISLEEVSNGRFF